MRYYSTCSIIAMVLLMVTNCASATLWISVLGGYRARPTHTFTEGGASDPSIRFIHSGVYLSTPVLWWSLA